MIEQAVDLKDIKLPDKVTNIMNTWVLQMGFPVITINTSTAVVSQHHFLLDQDSEVSTLSPSQYVQESKWIELLIFNFVLLLMYPIN